MYKNLILLIFFSGYLAVSIQLHFTCFRKVAALNYENLPMQYTEICFSCKN